jgi:hypothetical protein
MGTQCTPFHRFTNGFTVLVMKVPAAQHDVVLGHHTADSSLDKVPVGFGFGSITHVPDAPAVLEVTTSAITTTATSATHLERVPRDDGPRDACALAERDDMSTPSRKDPRPQTVTRVTKTVNTNVTCVLTINGRT